MKMMESGGAGSTTPQLNYRRPMRLAEILDRSLRLSVALFKELWVLFGILAGLQVAQELPALKEHLAVMIVIWVSSLFLSWYLLILGMVMSVEYWKGNPVKRKDVEQQVTFSLAFKLIDVAIRILLACLFGFLLLIIPGIVMMMRRSLAVYVLVIEGSSPKDSIKKSVYLMSQGKWNSLEGPLMRVSGIALLIWILNLGVGVVAVGAMFALLTNSIGVLAMSLLLFAVSWAAHFVSCFGYLCYAGLYFDLMARYEGADIVDGLDKFAQPAFGLTQSKTEPKEIEPARPLN